MASPLVCPKCGCGFRTEHGTCRQCGRDMEVEPRLASPLDMRFESHGGAPQIQQRTKAMARQLGMVL